MRSCLFLVLAFMAGVCGRAVGRTWIVASDGSGDFDSVSVACAAVSDGDSIVIRPGVYWEEEHDGPSDPPADVRASDIALVGSGGAPEDVELRVRILYRQPGGRVSNVSFQDVAVPLAIGRGFEVDRCVFIGNTHSDTYGPEGGALLVGGYGSVSRCRFERNRADGVDGVGGGIVISASSGGLIAVRECEFVENMAWLTGGAIEVIHGGALIEDCVFVSNMGYFGAGIDVFNGPATIRRCTFWNNGWDDHGSSIGVQAEYGPSASIENCIIARSGGYAIDVISPPELVQCCDLWQNGFEALLPPGWGNIYLDPMFCDPENGDFNLNVASPCLGGEYDGRTCEQMGAFGALCGGSPIRETTWGHLKSLFREGRATAR